MAYVQEHAALFDAQPNPFAHSAFQRHFLQQVARDDWTIHATASSVLGPNDTVCLTYQTPGGAPRQALTNYYASLYSPVVTACGDAARAAASLARSLTQRRRPPVLQLAPLSSEDAGVLAGALRREGWFVKRYFCFGNWYLPCAGMDYASFLAGRDSQMRNTLTRKSKKFLADPANRLEIVTSPADVDRAMDAYDRVLHQSWKTPEPYPEFMRGWARICAERGWLRLGIAWAGDVPVAVQFWFIRDGRAYIYKLAYDEAHAKLSAGTILTAHLFRHALDADRVSEIDYLTGDDAYKKGWMTHRRERVGLLVCDLRSPQGVLRAAFEFAGSVRRRLIERDTAVKRAARRVMDRQRAPAPAVGA